MAKKGKPRDTLSPALLRILENISALQNKRNSQKLRRKVSNELRFTLRDLIAYAPKGQTEPTFSITSSYTHPKTGERTKTLVKVRNGRPSERLWNQRLENSWVSKVATGRHAKMPDILKADPRVRFDPTYAVEARLAFDHHTVARGNGDTLLDWLIYGTNRHEIKPRKEGSTLKFWYGRPLRWDNAVGLLSINDFKGGGVSVKGVMHPGVDPESVSPKFNHGDFITPSVRKLEKEFEVMYEDVMAQAESLLDIRRRRKA